MDTNEMIDRYVNEVGQHLPRKTRADIEMELRSLLLDTLEEQSDGEPTPKITAELLREFGHPEAIAAQYRPEESLIGPKLFPHYKVGVVITVSIIGAFHLLGLGFALWQSGGADFVDKALSFIVSFGRSAIINAGIVTLVFALIERTVGDSLELPDHKAKGWNPFDLPPVKDPDRINRGELIVGIFFTIAFLVWLNFFPDWLGGVKLGEEGSGIFVLVTAEFLALIPWFSASLLLDVVLKTAVLIQGRWNRLTRWLEVGATGFGLYVTFLVFSLEQISTVPFFTTMAKAVLAIVLIIAIFELAGKLFRLLLGRPFTPRTFIKSKLA
ncbi:MAG: hypothetical protein H6656_15505 [Ardenticatenaceae bacterium]|nr:hypothetical protein [Ardenticatenaceae bacterium]